MLAFERRAIMRAEDAQRGGLMRRRLRAGTRDLHARVEHLSPFGPGLDWTSYVRHLELRLGFQGPMEALFAGWDDLLGFLPPRGGAALLRADLLALGVPPKRLDELPRCESLPDLTSLERALGGAYVLEGAKLGGQVIAARVSSALGIRGDGVRFLAGGEDPARARVRFGAAMDALDRHAAALDEQRRESIVAGARDTFVALARWLEEGANGRA